MRLLPSIVAAKLQVESGVLGKVKLVDAKLSCSNEFLRNAEIHDWRHDRRMNGGILSQYGSQILDVLNYITNSTVSKVSASILDNLCSNYHNEKLTGSDWRKTTADDFVSVHFAFENGVRGGMNLNGVSAEPSKFDLSVEIFCSVGKISIRDGKCSVVKEGSPHVDIIEDDFQSVPLENISTLEEDITSYDKVPVMTKQSLVIMAETLGRKWEKKVLKEEDRLKMPNFDDMLKVQATIEAIRKSGENSIKWDSVQVMKAENEVINLASLRHN